MRRSLPHAARLVAALVVLGTLGEAGGAAPVRPAKPDLLARADLLLDSASLSSDVVERFRLADEAAALCERAAVERPQDVEPVLRLVRALTISDPARPELCRPGRCEVALAHLARLRQRDGLAIEAARIASEEGIVLSRMQRFEEALLAYERALPLVEPARRANSLDERRGSVLLWGNSAETAMALGRLDEAIRRYELAIEHAAYGELEWQLALYGLGVALDRDGQGEAARRTVLRALEHDPALSRLHDEGVFFEPPGDVFYYEGLAHAVAGDQALATRAFERYLAALPDARHAGRARWHLEQLAALPRQPDAEGIRVEVGLPMSVRGRRSPESLRRTVLAHLRDLQICYGRLLRSAPGTPLDLQLGLEIAPTGFVGQRAHVLSTSEPALALSRCVELSADSWRFAPLVGGEPEAILVPLSLAPAHLGPAPPASPPAPSRGSRRPR